MLRAKWAESPGKELLGASSADEFREDARTDDRGNDHGEVRGVNEGEDGGASGQKQAACELNLLPLFHLFSPCGRGWLTNAEAAPGAIAIVQKDRDRTDFRDVFMVI